MKKIGLVGGISWVSTLDYYRYINEGINRRLGGLNFAECMIYSLNFNDVQKNGWDDWEATFQLLSGACNGLKDAGADAIVLCANTAHAIAGRLAEHVQLPLIHIATAAADAINKKGLKRVGLLGTKYTMELPFYAEALRARGIESICPRDPLVRNYVQHTIKEEMGRGVFSSETKAQYLKIIDQLIGDGAEGIVLGCTEIPLLVGQQDIPAAPVFDTTRIHADAAVDFALSG